jgi:hypothetical protein
MIWNPWKRIRELEAENTLLRTSRDAFLDATLPSQDTKTVHIGEYKFDHEVQQGAVTRVHHVVVPWTTIKEIMVGIRLHAVSKMD